MEDYKIDQLREIVELEAPPTVSEKPILASPVQTTKKKKAKRNKGSTSPFVIDDVTLVGKDSKETSDELDELIEKLKKMDAEGKQFRIRDKPTKGKKRKKRK